MVKIKSATVGIDSNFLIHMLNGTKEFELAIKAVFNHSLQIFASVLTHLESTVGLYKTDNKAELSRITHLPEFFANFRYVDIDINVSSRAAKLRAKYNFLRTPDSIHLATAIINRVDYFITEDKSLKKITELPVIHLSEIS